MRCYRMNPRDEDPQRLLSAEGQWTEPWGASEDSTRCDKCEGRGRTEHRCWSCVLTGAQTSCPVCAGRVRWEDVCPVCRGSGEIDGDPRHGVSVFPKLEGLYHYMLARDADIDGCVVLQLEAEPADDVDFDADEGALLVIPNAILDCADADRELLERVRASGG
jgi:hypothetical protein